ncbi:FtsW/RodA/SpoVE family cell cycle protein [Paenibacillus allorhizosphaerae]|uniref:Peptidoglycan glycosyltransferase MrdB n=1 Tax=Paenibacillus allorhizosphaerae TaxID=2849866 RepID=A0ABM8VIG8_9BACL|nr:FtsW/RodA/SpoVE family cell cycle protein [Paenibacillus allorhizosphaerae]CAG7644188.1 Peptidoglycan glycosyltransferase MrdB [Paenibacillus allorhizosphaerae]
MIRDHEEVRRFLGEVCLHIKAREVHADIRKELLDHIEELTVEKEAEGFSREDSTRWAVSQMGDPAAIGSGLHKVHRPRMNWGLLLAALGFVLLGIFVMYMFELSVASEPSPYASYHFFLSKTAAVALGLLIMSFFYFWDYRKLYKWSWPIYGIVVTGMLYVLVFGNPINGARSYISFGRFAVDWMGVSPYLLIISATGILLSWRGKRSFCRSYLAFVIVPVFLLLSSPNLVAAVLYLTGYTAVYGAVSRRWFIAFAQTAGTFLAVAIPAVLTKQYIIKRLAAYWNPEADPTGAGYVAVQMKSAIQTGGWLGQGFASPLSRLPSIPNELVYVYVMYCFGWLAGAAVAVAVVYFIGRVVQSSKAVHEPYGKTMIIGITALLGFQMGYSVLMSFGLVPLTGMPFPFLSYGGSHLLAELAAIGIVLGIYRRKDLVRIKLEEQPY